MPRILVIDDDRGVRDGVVAYLRRLGHEVLQAADGVAGVEALRSQPVDLVITDINMPDMDGIEVINHLRSAGDCPVIAMSGGGLFAKELLLKNAEMLGATYTLPKPFELDQLRETVERALAGPASSTG